MFSDDDEFIDYLQNVLNIGFMGNKESMVKPSRDDMRQSIKLSNRNTITKSAGGRLSANSTSGIQGVNATTSRANSYNTFVTNSILKPSKTVANNKKKSTMNSSDRKLFASK